MFLSMNWISDFVDLSGLDKLALIQQFSLSTAEVENDIFFKGSDISGIVVAEIKSVENHPDSKKLHLLKVDAGDGVLTDVVCGAPNVRVGMKTAFAKVGAQIGDITIAPRKLAGYTSNGWKSPTIFPTAPTSRLSTKLTTLSLRWTTSPSPTAPTSGVTTALRVSLPPSPADRSSRSTPRI